jgi:hypothetical protein
LTDHVDPTPNTSSTEGKYVLIADMESFIKRLTGDGPTSTGCKDAKSKPLEPGQKLVSILFARKKTPKKICGYGPQLFYTMTRTCTSPTTPAYHPNSPPPPPPPPPLSFFCELLYIATVFFISAALLLSTACAFGLAKAFDKLTGVKIPCRELLFVFLTLFPAPGAAVTQALADQSSIQVVVHTNINASTSMVAVDPVASWAQLVTACTAQSASITLSPAFKMGAYTNEIDFRLVLYMWLFKLDTVP